MKSNTYKEYIAPTVVLVAICLIITGALAYVNSITAPIIEENSAAAANEARFELLPEADDFTAFDGDLTVMAENQVFVSDCYVANNGAGIVVTVESKSYGGLLTEMIGIDSEGAITGVKVTNHSDTPGLGTKAQTPEYLSQYIGLTEYADVNVKNDSSVTYVSGATVTSNAVHYGVCAALEQYKVVSGGAN